jgi:hypothetical protein
MLHSHPLLAGLGLLALTLGACTTAPPSPLAQDHPASIHAPAAAVQTEPSALTAYRDFRTAPSAPPPADAPAMDHSMHEQHEHGGSSTEQDDQEGAHANHH